MGMNDSQRHINQEIRDILLRHKKGEAAFKDTILEGKERKYTLINEKDRRTYLTLDENKQLDSHLDYYLRKIEEGREKEGKEPFNTYLVINTDESYSDEIVSVMKQNGHFN